MTVSKYDLPEDIRLRLEKFLEETGVILYWIEVKERIFCGKSRCLKCSNGKGHEGPFYYVHYRDPNNGKLRTKYLGKPRSQKVSYETPRKLRKTDESIPGYEPSPYLKKQAILTFIKKRGVVTLSQLDDFMWNTRHEYNIHFNDVKTLVKEGCLEEYVDEDGQICFKIKEGR